MIFLGSNSKGSPSQYSINDSFESDEDFDPREEQKQPISNGFHLKKVAEKKDKPIKPVSNRPGVVS
jgi:hypothetical protein